VKQRFFKATGLLVMIIFLFSLIGCSSTTESKESVNQKVKSTEVKKEQKKPTTAAEQNNKQVPATSATSQPNTAATKSSAVASSTNTAHTQTSPNVKSSTPAASAPPAQAKPTLAAGTSQTATSSSVETITKQTPVQTVRITIIGPKDKGTMMNGKTVNINDGDTVLSVLLSAAKASNIFVDYSGSGATAYVRGIDNIYEFDYGSKSGWICSQNGTELSRSAGAVQVKAGDQIEWKYTEDYTVNK
jgi:uncharacterized protein YcfL